MTSLPNVTPRNWLPILRCCEQENLAATSTTEQSENLKFSKSKLWHSRPAIYPSRAPVFSSD